MSESTAPLDRARAAELSLLQSFLRATELDTRMLGMVGALALIWIIFHILSGGLFLTPRNLWNLSVQSASIAVSRSTAWPTPLPCPVVRITMGMMTRASIMIRPWTKSVRLTARKPPITV